MHQPFQDATRNASIIPGLYPFYTLWGIAFLSVFDYSVSQEYAQIRCSALYQAFKREG